MSNWIDWQGGECPVDGDALVEVRFRCGDTPAAVPAGTWGWDHQDDDDDIVAYRVLPTFADLAEKDAEIDRLRAELAVARALLADEHTMRTVGRLPSKCQQPDCAYVGQTTPRMCDCHADAEQKHSRAVLAAIKGKA